MILVLLLRIFHILLFLYDFSVITEDFSYFVYFFMILVLLLRIFHILLFLYDFSVITEDFSYFVISLWF